MFSFKIIAFGNFFVRLICRSFAIIRCVFHIFSVTITSEREKKCASKSNYFVWSAIFQSWQQNSAESKHAINKLLHRNYVWNCEKYGRETNAAVEISATIMTSFSSHFDFAFFPLDISTGMGMKWKFTLPDDLSKWQSSHDKVTLCSRQIYSQSYYFPWNIFLRCKSHPRFTLCPWSAFGDEFIFDDCHHFQVFLGLSISSVIYDVAFLCFFCQRMCANKTIVLCIC